MYTKESRLNHNSRDTLLRDDLKNVKDKFSETGQAIHQTARDARAQAKDYLKSSLDDINERTSDLQHNVASYVKKNPVKAVGIAVIAGLIISKLFHR